MGNPNIHIHTIVEDGSLFRLNMIMIHLTLSLSLPFLTCLVWFSVLHQLV